MLSLRSFRLDTLHYRALEAFRARYGLKNSSAALRRILEVVLESEQDSHGKKHEKTVQHEGNAI
jgi:hypothetical protein